MSSKSFGPILTISFSGVTTDTTDLAEGNPPQNRVVPGRPCAPTPPESAAYRRTNLCTSLFGSYKQSFNNYMTIAPYPNLQSLNQMFHTTGKQLSKMSLLCCGNGGDENINAEHMGANLLPCNAAARLQARTRAERTCLHWNNWIAS